MEIARWDEALLVQRCKEGSEAAFAELVRRHRPRLFTLAYRLTGDRDTAEDVVQETFVAAFRALDRFEPRPSLAAWLNTIAVRSAGKASAKLTAGRMASLDGMLDDDEAHRLLAATSSHADDPHRAAEAAELRRAVATAIAALPFKYRAAVITRFVLGFDYAEAAGSLEMGLNTYKSHLLRGTRMLRETLAPAAGRSIAPGRAATPVPLAPAVAATTASGHGPEPRVIAPRATARAFAEPRRARFDLASQEKAVPGSR